MYLFKKTKFSSFEEALLKPENCRELQLMNLNENLIGKGGIFLKFVNLEKLDIQADSKIYNLLEFVLPEEIGQLKK
ncbi:hypothetical protein FNO01nite_20950 [Flavobacterium noncentrifugens]|uniref:Uncharacterized protein n=1 Tax=Flavobacterium noncentrifugens TaxID=1128970 RepID=A0A1G8Z149_9FLAO|nr:hypothetical protein [Flavobacterium noncentrifugens]GEP51423.1 hypothetical protein FNO01nite_20950 [Flavobacterium noncentrifugens]SDK08374.1 hypothetical protein SAMN04487935_2545 [Flavobacterium noncentrifugens]